MTIRQSEEAPYTSRSIQEMLGLSRGAIAGLVASGFVTPSRGPGNALRYTFRDVVLMRTAVELQAARIAPRKILAALRKLRASLPAEVPLTGLRITAVGNDVTVREGRSQWQAETGQLVMDFEVAPQQGNVAFLQRTPARAGTAPVASRGSRAAADESDDPERDAMSWFCLGEVLEASDPRAAEKAYRKALALNPAHADTYLNLGALLCEGKRCEEAVALFDEAVRRYPHEALLHFNRAVALEDQGRARDALASYDAALRLDPDLADAHYNAARLHEQAGDARKAVRHFNAYRRLQR
ncbi:MAG TPA: tetratricopeptide repeat protein [Caldimonas sp.]|nr:tetratricopeptide repeat protein [Caldimonas sp.]HEX2539716.1 tetratricopeptide repeat protein [Caldimonas sp.]